MLVSVTVSAGYIKQNELRWWNLFYNQHQWNVHHEVDENYVIRSIKNYTTYDFVSRLG